MSPARWHSSPARSSRSSMSFDVPRHRHRPIEIYGTEGAMSVPDPNWFGGTSRSATAAEDWKAVPTEHTYADGNYRSSASPTWRRPSARTARTAPAATWRFTCWKSWRRSSARPTSGRRDRHRQPSGAAGRHADEPRAGRARLRVADLNGGRQKMREALIVWGGWSGHEPEQCAPIIKGMLEAGRLQGPGRERRPRPSPIPRSPI